MQWRPLSAPLTHRDRCSASSTFSPLGSSSLVSMFLQKMRFLPRVSCALRIFMLSLFMDASLRKLRVLVPALPPSLLSLSLLLLRADVMVS